MPESNSSPTAGAPAKAPRSAEPPVAVGVAELARLLAELDRGEPRAAAPTTLPGTHVDNQLAQVRLGIASSLFAALRCRHAALASHSLRVALNCSAWATKLGMAPNERDVVEVAALLHDMGLVGVPDQILLKPGPLTRDEALIIQQSRRMSVEILRHACAEPRILEIVENLGAWYNGSKGGYRFAEHRIPAGARMIAIAEAFDSMTTDQVFRRAVSQERAMRELFDSAGTQFDPRLVQQFAEYRVCDQTSLRREVAKRWLHDLAPETADSFWELCDVPAPPGHADTAQRFEKKLLENMHDAVVFIDAGMRITEWNRGAERLTGIAGSSVLQHPWSPSLLNMQNEKGEWLLDQDCPIRCVIQSHVQSLRRLTIAGRAGRPVSVDSHAIPVTAADGTALGAVLLLHDASPEASLEERCQTLYEKATKDPLTQVANRAEFDRVHEMFIRAHREHHVTCSLMICDLDHFKRVNDTYGHQAGDDVIQALASVLRSGCGPGDLVARYGGEEFVMLCADCDNATATRRAEQSRKALSQITHPKLGGRVVTASFGVTEVQPGDTAESMLRRADRALLLAKEKGRNTVVQLGVGADPPSSASSSASTPASGRDPKGEASMVVEQSLVTSVPLWMAVEKLRGFVADHGAKIVKVDGDYVQLTVEGGASFPTRRFSDRPTVFRVDIRLSEEEGVGKDGDAASQSGWSQTRIRVKVAPEKNRERRREEVVHRAKEVLASFRSYLMAHEEESADSSAILSDPR